MFDIVFALKVIPAAIMGLTIHEFAHAYVSYKLGDNTAKDNGRISLNPLRHIDPLGFILIIIAGFGWAKPVSFSPANLKSRKRDQILIALAGPISNFILALAILAIARILYFAPFFNGTNLGVAIIKLLVLWVAINLGLFIFNLLPIPPLDGSHVYMAFSDKKNEAAMRNIYKTGTAILLAIIILEKNFDMEILPIAKSVTFLLNRLTSLFFFQ